MAGTNKLDKEVARKLEEFNKATVTTAEDVVFRIFPNKIIELQRLIQESASPSSQFHLSHASPSTDPTVYPQPSSSSEQPEPKKRKLAVESNPNGAAASGSDVQFARYPSLVLSNKHVIKVHADLKKECEELADLCDKVKLWINLSMPRIEDGDNFGVQIQEEVLTELQRSHESALNMRDAARQNHLTRAKISSKIIKYPHVEDYALALKEHDEKQLYIARQNLLDLRNVYAILTDILHKNITKIRSPKGNNSSAMY